MGECIGIPINIKWILSYAFLVRRRDTPKVCSRWQFVNVNGDLIGQGILVNNFIEFPIPTDCELVGDILGIKNRTIYPT